MQPLCTELKQVWMTKSKTPIFTRYKPEDMKPKGVGAAVIEQKNFICSQYNLNTCSLGDTHLATVKGKSVTVENLCAACWLKGNNKEKYAECENECPLFKDGLDGNSVIDSRESVNSKLLLNKSDSGRDKLFNSDDKLDLN